MGLIELVIFRNGVITRCGETDNPSYLALADDVSRLLIDGFVLEVLCNSPYQSLRSILGKVFPHELDPRGDVLRNWLLAQNMLSSRECFQHDLWLLVDRKDDENGVDVRPCQEGVNGIVGVAIVVDRRICSDPPQSRFQDGGEVSRTFLGTRVDGLYGYSISERGQSWNIRFITEDVRPLDNKRLVEISR